MRRAIQLVRGFRIPVAVIINKYDINTDVTGQIEDFADKANATVLGRIPYDPETGLSIMRMDLIHNQSVTPDGSVSLIFRPSSPVCPMAYSLASAIKKRLGAIRRTVSVRIRVENFERAAHLEGILQRTNVQGKVD
jgi:metal-sulfur cluster biosynthetic enzyme